MSCKSCRRLSLWVAVQPSSCVWHAVTMSAGALGVCLGMLHQWWMWSACAAAALHGMLSVLGHSAVCVSPADASAPSEGPACGVMWCGGWSTLRHVGAYRMCNCLGCCFADALLELCAVCLLTVFIDCLCIEHWTLLEVLAYMFPSTGHVPHMYHSTLSCLCLDGFHCTLPVHLLAMYSVWTGAVSDQ